MKSNFDKLFKEKVDEYRTPGAFCMDDLVDEIMEEIEFYDHPKKAEFVRWYVKRRAETESNKKECYSFKKNWFVALDAASLKDLRHMDDDFLKLIASCQETEKNIVEKIKEREKYVGQMRINPDGSIEEEKSITDLIGEAVGT